MRGRLERQGSNQALDRLETTTDAHPGSRARSIQAPEGIEMTAGGSGALQSVTLCPHTARFLPVQNWKDAPSRRVRGGVRSRGARKY